MKTPLIDARELSRHYTVSQGMFHKPAVVKALEGVNVTVYPGQTLAVVGESGSGKSTLARLLAMIEKPTSGTLTIDGIDAVAPTSDQVLSLRRRVQMVFQNPYASLNPRKRVAHILEEPLKLSAMLPRAERRACVADMLTFIGLSPEHATRYPHMFSGGQRQRIAIARALMLQPKLIVADEPTSALDVSIQAQILNLFMDVQQRLGTAYIFISHNLGVVEHIAQRVMVMYLGHVVESAPKGRLFAQPMHPYTQALLSATPSLVASRSRRRITIVGEPPSPLNPPSGCSFHKRCRYARERCAVEVPALRHVDGTE
ncbi:MAG TPA: dipeptide ABC transporter ATP-binding protein, partial [Burkholderiaceae bacterium]|nr:dipeptide ABC transporter ATP-binding protein [Burkholderiaceae bacterium]